jgi:hypothetical protein
MDRDGGDGGDSAGAGDGGGGGGGGGGSNDGRFVQQVLFGPGFNMGCINLSLPEDGEQDFSEPDPDEAPAPSCTQMTATSVFTGDPLSHYISDCG